MTLMSDSANVDRRTTIALNAIKSFERDGTLPHLISHRPRLLLTS